MPTFNVRYLPVTGSVESIKINDARDRTVARMVEPISKIVPEVFNEIGEIEDPEQMFTSDDVFVGLTPFDARDWLATDIKVLGAIPLGTFDNKDIFWRKREELRESLDVRLGMWVVENALPEARIEMFEVELIPQPSCGRARNLVNGMQYAQWGGPADLKQ